MLGDLLPPSAVVEEAFDDVADEPPYPGEEVFVARAVPARRREFVTSRRCARRALGRLGVPAAPIPAGRDGQPRWPVGVVGSITHCAGYRAAAVAPASTVAAIGIDAEPHSPLRHGVLELAASPAERAALSRLAAANSAIHWDRMLFSAKESIFKAWFPLTGRRLGFLDASVLVAADGTFAADLTRLPRVEITGRWVVDRGLILTAVAFAPQFRHPHQQRT